MWDSFVRSIYAVGHRLLVGSIERMLFPASLIGDGLPPIRDELKRRRHPIILLHGYGDQPYGSQDMARSLRRDGWTVYVFETPQMGLAGIDAAVASLHELVSQVKRETGATKVDLVGHSQGGVIARAFVKFGNDAASVGRVVSLASPHHGLKAWFNGPIDAMLGSQLLNPLISHGLDELLMGRAFWDRLNAGDPTPDGVRFTSIFAATFDGMVIPQSAWLEGATNVVLRRDRDGRGPHHFMINHQSLEAYVQLRLALLDLPPLDGTHAPAPLA
ncbi:MAG: lipase class 2 [Thermoleophilia bacterium]|nr:lipase class 2 [Thermoleophilia bacterium]